MKNLIYPEMHFIGSKQSIWPWIYENLPTNYETVLDLFGGSGVVSHGFRLLQKTVFYNDFLKFLRIQASGLLQSVKEDRITENMINKILDFSEFEYDNNFFKKYYSDLDFTR